MNDKSRLEDQYERTVDPVVKKIDANNWDKAQGITIGAAGLSTAIVFLLTQIGIEGNTPLCISFFCASLAIPVWIALWQAGEAYSFHGPASHGHLRTLWGSGVSVLIFLSGSSLLLASLTLLIWNFSAVSAVCFFATCVVMVIFVYKHNVAVRAWAESNKPSGT